VAIGVMSALQGEIQMLLRRMTRVESTPALGRQFYAGELQGQKIVVVGSGVGKVRASACAQHLIDEYSVESMIVFGLAGALNSDLRVGDIVVSDTTVMYDYVVAGEGVNENIEIGPIQADPHLAELALRATRFVSPKGGLYGKILTGDAVVADSGRRAILRRDFDGDCVEMEGAAAALVCSLNGVPFVIVRAISDLADESAHSQFELAFEHAANRSADVVLHMLRLISQPEAPDLARTPARSRCLLAPNAEQQGKSGPTDESAKEVAQGP
jgi:adenosylhomocysteine nucleosidase